MVAKGRAFVGVRLEDVRNINVEALLEGNLRLAEASQTDVTGSGTCTHNTFMASLMQCHEAD